MKKRIKILETDAALGDQTGRRERDARLNATSEAGKLSRVDRDSKLLLNTVPSSLLTVSNSTDIGTFRKFSFSQDIISHRLTVCLSPIWWRGLNHSLILQIAQLRA
jgi:hypothetical protein